MKQPRNSIATVASRLLKFAERPYWADVLDEHWSAFLELAAEQLNQTPEEVADALDALGLESMAFAMVFENFATHRDDAGGTFLTDYLKRAGWRESAPARKYLHALRDSTVGLYEILEVHRDKGFLLRDLLDADAAPLFVDERSATHHLARWDIVAGRVLAVLNRHQFSGGLLPIQRDTYTRAFQPEWETVRDDPAARAGFLHTLPITAALLWLFVVIEQANAPLPEVINDDGEAVIPCTVRLPLLAPAEAVAAALDAARDWVRAGDAPPFWNWIGGAPDTPAEQPPDAGRGQRVQSYTQAGEPVRGNAELQGERLVFTTLSADRMERGLVRLRALLGTALGEALVEYDNLQEVLTRKGTQSDDRAPKDDAIDPEVAAQLIRETLDRHYRAVLDQPIPVLDGLTPRQAAAEPQTRDRAIEWLKSLESHEDRRSARDGQPPYDTRWLWVELGLNEKG
ncbi:hypothetical protein [Acidihalobacter ferrooxydans]|uniref:Antitoxin Xre/MbcA/ParS-like toxin-binding domain-containing protein n=1 Tax=Acidihalobacter ferrooxydans TaxID=1765967 RepID=A0A1P8UF06_9GAMM|nr:hypothetical protein [Acidihalobacter ferrooxydans]APZ42411.1 hypothetical protein BW247_04335 [Acidihalobacter ferrooxydans]